MEMTAHLLGWVSLVSKTVSSGIVIVQDCWVGCCYCPRLLRCVLLMSKTVGLGIVIVHTF